MSKEAISEQLEQHWAMDVEAADVLSQRIVKSGQEAVIEEIANGLDHGASIQRDINREEIADIFTKRSDKGLMVAGPCSLDTENDYGPLFDFIDQLQEENPGAVIALRANSAKPRSSGGWTGLWYSTDPDERKVIFDTYKQAFNRGIPIVNEVTQSTQLGALAPWMSGVWIGARDVQSTTLRSAVSAIHIPVGIKNGIDGSLEAVQQGVTAVRKGSSDNDGSGVELTIASNQDFTGIPTGIIPVGTGNQEVAIIARGYELPEHMSGKQRRKAALDYLSSMCALGAEMGTAVLIDGTHSVPPMLEIKRKDPDRIIPVMKEFNKALHHDEIVDPDQLAGVIAEVGVSTGRTDPNYVLDDVRKHQLAKLVKVTMRLLSEAS